MKIIDLYILKKFLKTFFFAIMIIALIACVIDYTQKVDDFVNNNAPILRIAQYFMFFVPHISALLYPLFVFIATIFFTSVMANRTEIIAILASGVSFTRFLRPYVYGSIILGFIALFANHIVVPYANEQIRIFHVDYIWSRPYSTDNNIHIRLNEREYVYFQNFDYPKKESTRMTLEILDGVVLKEKITAERAIYDSVTNDWLLKTASIRKFDGDKETFKNVKEHRIQLNLLPEDILNDERKKEALTTPQLLKTIAIQRQRGSESLNSFLFELHKRTAEPFAGFILTIIGACLASRKIRGGSGLHLAIGVGICAVYVLFLQVSKTFSINAGFNPFISMWIPNIIFGIIAIVMYRKKTQ